jgi:hypothetical protein
LSHDNGRTRTCPFTDVTLLSPYNLGETSLIEQQTSRIS